MKRQVQFIEQRTAVTATVKVEQDGTVVDTPHEVLVAEAEALFKEAYAVAHRYTQKKNL